AGAFLGGWRLMAVDGMEWDVPDTPANRAFFGSTAGPAGPAPFPKVRGGTISECGSHAAGGGAAGPVAGGEGRGGGGRGRREGQGGAGAGPAAVPGPGPGLAADRGPELLLLRRLVHGGGYRGGAAVAGPVERAAAGAGAAAGRVLAVGADQPAARLPQPG